MSASKLAAALVEKLDERASADAMGHVVLASVQMETLAQEPFARIEARLQRKTRTLVFTEADAFGANGARIASASAVHRIREQR